MSLLRAASWNISGDRGPSRPGCTTSRLSGPTGTHTRVVPADGVLHVSIFARLPDPLARRGSVEARAVTQQAHSGSRGGADS